MSAILWKQRLPASPKHKWFEAFEHNEAEALDSLFFGTFDLANLAVEEPSVLLTKWVRTIGNTGDFVSKLDYALANWIETNWGLHRNDSIAVLRSTWNQLGAVIAATAPPAPRPSPLAEASMELRHRLLGHSGFASTLFAFRGCDALHSCLNAIALNQRDDKLHSLWWRLVELPGGFPIRYANVALNGIRCLNDPSGLFRYDVMSALFDIARVFSRKVQEETCTEMEALEEFHYLYCRVRANYEGFIDQWRDVLQLAIRPQSRKNYIPSIWSFIEREAKKFFSQIPELDAIRYSSETPLRSWELSADLQPTWDIYREPKVIANKLQDRRPRAIEDAEELLDKQQKYARRTGDYTYLAKSLHKFATKVRGWDIPTAIRWAREGIDISPNDPRTWTLLVNLLKLEDASRAWRLAWALVERFPLDAYVRTGLAEVLKEQGRLGEAEEVYRQTIEDFPYDIVARTSLAEIFKKQNKLSEAEAIYRKTAKYFPFDPWIANGLAHVLIQKALAAENANELFKEALQLYESIATSTHADIKSRCVALCGWAGINERLNELEAAEQLYQSVLRLDRYDTYAQVGLERLARRRREGGRAEFFEPLVDSEKKTTELIEALPWDDTLADDESRASADAIRGSEAPAGVRRWHLNGYHLRLARSTFFRRSASYQENLPINLRRISPERLRISARKMLNEVLDLLPNDALALAELASLDIEQRNTPYIPSELILEGTPEILTVAAKAARVKAKKEEVKLTDVKARDLVFEPALRLRGIGPTAKPLADLMTGLGYLALLDGNERLAHTAVAFEHLRYWVGPRAREAAKIIESQGRKVTLPPILAWSDRLTTNLRDGVGIDLTSETQILPETIAQVESRFDEVLPILDEASLDYAKKLSPRIKELFESFEE